MPGLRVPGCWDPFELAVRAILGQQVSVKGATTLAGRLVQTFGAPLLTGPPLTHLFPAAEVLAEANVARLDFRENELKQFALWPVPCEKVESSLIQLRTSNIFGRAFANFRESGTGPRNTLHCERWANRTHSPPVIWVCCVAPRWTTNANSPGERNHGDRGEPTRQCICGRETTTLRSPRKRPVAERSSETNAFKAPGRGEHQSDAGQP